MFRSILVAGLAFTTGCFAVNPGNEFHPPDMTRNVAPTDDMAEESGPLDPPTLGPVPGITPWDTVNITGKGPASGRIIIESNLQGSFLGVASLDGSFCIDVKLVEGSDNVLSIRAQDADGSRISEAIQKTIRREGAPPSPEQTPPTQAMKNVAMGGGSAYSPGSTIYGGGTTDNVIDGDRSTSLGITASQGTEEWFRVSLVQRSSVNKITFVVPAKCANQPGVLVQTDVANAGDPTSTNTNWTEVQTVAVGGYTCDASNCVLEAGMPAHTVREVAFRFTSAGCATFGGSFGTEHFASEIEVMSVPGAPTPTSPKPVCPF